ncbi:MAG: helix-turn-helix transcriptional regulator [Bacteroidales bacterium]|nr:helix-turn-helix transcriptional regulator [Bacteroidales bacterium]
MKEVKVFIEKAEFGFSAYMEEAGLDYGCTGEGATVQEAIDDFNLSYVGIRDYYESIGKRFEEIHCHFYYDTASFLAEYCEAFSLAGLERITGINQKQLGHYLHGQSKPSRKTIEKIEAGVKAFAANLTAVQFT